MGMGVDKRVRGERISTAALDPSVCISVAQQEIAFGVAIGIENYYSSSRRGKDANWVPTFVAMGSLFASAGLIFTQSELWGRVGFLFCAIITFVVIGKYAKQFLDAGELPSEAAGIDGDEDDWPGPQATPAFGIFMSLMAFLAATEGLAAL